MAPLVWKRFGQVQNYVEPFAGSLATLLGRPDFKCTETVNDADGLISNFWRALQWDADTVAAHADWPVNENDLHARHAWLVGQKDSLQAKLEGDPKFYDAQAAGWWVWGMACWIGSGFCSGNGPWQVAEVDGVSKLVHLGDAGRGVNRQLVHLGDAGRGVNRQLVHLGNAGRGVNRQRDSLYVYLRELSDRLQFVRVCCGDWSRVCGPSVTFKHGLTGVFLDPPYSAEAGRADLYRVESATVAHDVREWCLENGGNTLMRIALCGYVGEGHEELERNGWSVEHWKAKGGFASQGNGDDTQANSRKERIWFSPHCIAAGGLFDGMK